MNFNFTEVHKSKTGADGVPEGVLRFGSKSIAIAHDEAAKFGYPSSRLDELATVKLTFAYDTYSQALKVTRDDVNGFSFKMGTNGTIFGRTPIMLMRSGMPFGDYKAVEDQRHVFQLAR